MTRKEGQTLLKKLTVKTKVKRGTLIAFDHWVHKLPTLGKVVRIRKDGRRKIIYVATRPAEEFLGRKADFIRENGRVVQRKDLVELFNETVREMAEVVYRMKYKKYTKSFLKNTKKDR